MLKNQCKHPNATLYFNDGIRKIDFVLAYVDEDVDKETSEKSKRRKIYEKSLESCGLHLEREPKELSQDQKTYFLKLHIPWKTCLKYAEKMKMKKPLIEDEQMEDEKDKWQKEEDRKPKWNYYKKLKQRFFKPFQIKDKEIMEQFENDDSTYTAEFKRDKMDVFDIKNQNTFFSDAERSKMVYHILSKAQFEEERTKIGIDKLKNNGTYVAAYPLHKADLIKKKPLKFDLQNLRNILYWKWAKWRCWYKIQPLNLIRVYFGDKIAIYFAWLGFYTQMLIYPSIVGLICFLYSIIAVWSYTPTQEICDENIASFAGDLVMCPLCDDGCNYWPLKTACTAQRISQVFDNESSIFFSVFMALWATMFLEFWKRRQYRLAYHWDLIDELSEDLLRPEYEAKVVTKKLNPITGQMEPYLPAKERYARTVFSLVNVIFWVAVIIAAVFAIIVYKLGIRAVLTVELHVSSEDGLVGRIASPSVVTTVTASLLSLIVIMMLNQLYAVVARRLTKLELPRTQIEYENSYILKTFWFQFVNFYSYFFYIAFFQDNFVGRPGDYNYLFGRWRWSGCEIGGCMYQLFVQLIITLVGKQAINNILELVIPWISKTWRQRKSEKESEKDPTNVYTQWEKDYDLGSLSSMPLFSEYLEMVIQFGFVTLFVVAFPLAPLIALINNVIEIRLDARKFISDFRRPVAQDASNIGAWYFLLDFLGTLAVITNAFIIAVTSETIPKLMYYYEVSPQTFRESTYRGYINNSLSVFDVNDFQNGSMPEEPPEFTKENITYCRYRGYRQPPTDPRKYELTIQHWKILAARLAFVIVVEHVVFFLKVLLDYLIPDQPQELVNKIKRQNYLVQKTLFKDEEEEGKEPEKMERTSLGDNDTKKLAADEAPLLSSTATYAVVHEENGNSHQLVNNSIATV